MEHHLSAIVELAVAVFLEISTTIEGNRVRTFTRIQV